MYLFELNIFITIIITFSLIIIISANLLLIYHFIKRKSIKLRVLWAFVNLIINSSMVIYSISTIIAYKSEKNQIEKHLESISDIIEDEIKLWVKNLEYELIFTDIIDNFIDKIKILIFDKNRSEFFQTINNYLLKVINNSQWLNKLFILSTDGYVILSTNNRDIGEYRGLQDYFIKGKIKQFTFVQVFSYSSLTEGINQIITVKPIFDKNNNLICVLCGEASLDKLNEIIKFKKGIGNTGEILLIGKNMVLLTNSKYKGFNAGTTYISSKSVLEAIKNKSKGITSYYDYRNIKVIGAYRWIKELEIVLVAKQDEIEAYRNIYINVIINIFLTLFFLIIAFILSFIFTKNITEGIILLNEGAKIISSGNLDYKILINSNDEIGNLSNTLNIMTEKLNNYFKEINESETRLRLALEGVGDGVWDWNIESGEVYYSKKWKEIIGYEDSDNIHTFNEWKDLVHPEDIEKTLLLIKKHLNGETPFFRSEHRLLCKDGKYKWVLARGKIIEWDNNKKPKRFIGTQTDITERKKIEEEFIKNQKIQSIGILAGGIAHDFNNILGGITGNIYLTKYLINSSDLLINKKNELFDILKDIEIAITHARSLTRQLLTFSSGGTPIKKLVSIKKLIYEITNFTLAGSNVTCEFLIDENLLNAEIDEGQITQVMNNLIINSIQSMPHGGKIIISASNENIPAFNNYNLVAGKYIKISVKDFGVGIKKENLSKIFDPYFTTKPKGYGLGLAICYSIIQKHNGFITVDSKENCGTTVTFYIPASDMEIDIQDEKNNYLFTKKRFKGNILIMDDDENIRIPISKILISYGFNVSTTKNGKETIELYKQKIEEGNPFDIVILDLIIPGEIGGEEVIKELIKIDSKVKAIISSGYSFNQIMSNYKEFGFKDVLLKPYKVEDLLDTINKILLKS